MARIGMTINSFTAYAFLGENTSSSKGSEDHVVLNSATELGYWVDGYFSPRWSDKKKGRSGLQSAISSLL